MKLASRKLGSIGTSVPRMLRPRLGLNLLFGLAALVLPSTLLAAQFDIVGPAGSGTFGKTVTVLPNGNFVVTSPEWNGSRGAAATARFVEGPGEGGAGRSPAGHHGPQRAVQGREEPTRVGDADGVVALDLEHRPVLRDHVVVQRPPRGILQEPYGIQVGIPRSHLRLAPRSF